MNIIGCDFHSRYQVIAMLDTQTGELVTHRFEHENGEAKTFYASLPRPSLIGMEATGYRQWFERLSPWTRRRRQELLDLLDRLHPRIEELNQAVEAEAARRPEVLRLMGQPGVGPVTALAFVLTLGPVERFRHSRQVVSYLGLNPREHPSGGCQRLGAISKQGNSLLRWLLVEAAQSAAWFDPELGRQYQLLKFRRGGQIAKVAIARQWAVCLYWRLRQDSPAVPPVRMPGSPSSAVVPSTGSRE